jgi:protein-S-isoprenylcysteine O-methyltransferase Ste14
VTGGVYRYTRNPMYLGMLLGLAGWAVALTHLSAPLWVMGYAAYLNRFQIVPEERALTARFGAVFGDYRRRARRWL